MSRRFRYYVAPGWGKKNSMAAWDTIQVVIPINKDEVYEDARVILHKYGDARLTSENEYHIHVAQADDMDEDTLLFDRMFARGFKDATTACMAYIKTAASNTGYINISPSVTTFTASEDAAKNLEVEASGDWTLTLTDELAQRADSSVNKVEYLYAIGLMMPSTWRNEVYESLCDNVYDLILFTIVSNFLKIVNPQEYRVYEEMRQMARIYVKDALEMREPFTRYIEIKPF